jgi:carbonic anhydrase
MGTIKDLDGTLYWAKEIQIHTPAEHTISGEKYDVEVQIIHESMAGTFRNQAVLSILFEEIPGAKNTAIQEWNLVNLPNPQ